MKYNLKYNLSLPFWKLEFTEEMADMELRHEFTTVALDMAYIWALSTNSLVYDCKMVEI